MTLTLAPKMIAVPLGVGALVIAGLAARGDWSWAVGLAVIVSLGYGLVLERRIDFGSEGLTLTPMLPLRPRQRFAWPAVETPRWGVSYGGFGTIKVPLATGRYRFAGVIPRRRIDLTAIYKCQPGSQTLSAPEVAALIQRYRIEAVC